MTPAQERALERLWPVYGMNSSSAPLDFTALYGRRAPVVLEIGFGNGEVLVENARQHPDLDYLGIEVHLPGMGNCLLRSEKAGLSNLRLIARDAIDVLQYQIARVSLDRVNLYFPDPWPKKRHHKRRIVQPDFLRLVAQKLASNGELFIATDWADYARHIDEVLAQAKCFDLIERREHTDDARPDRVTSKFERRGIALGHTIWDWQLRRVLQQNQSSPAGGSNIY